MTVQELRDLLADLPGDSHVYIEIMTGTGASSAGSDLYVDAFDGICVIGDIPSNYPF